MEPSCLKICGHLYILKAWGSVVKYLWIVYWGKKPQFLPKIYRSSVIKNLEIEKKNIGIIPMEYNFMVNWLYQCMLTLST